MFVEQYQEELHFNSTFKANYYMKYHFNPHIIILTFQLSKWLKCLLKICVCFEKCILRCSLGINYSHYVPSGNLKSTSFHSYIFFLRH